MGGPREAEARQRTSPHVLCERDSRPRAQHPPLLQGPWANAGGTPAHLPVERARTELGVSAPPAAVTCSVHGGSSYWERGPWFSSAFRRGWGHPTERIASHFPAPVPSVLHLGKLTLSFLCSSAVAPSRPPTTGLLQRVCSSSLIPVAHVSGVLALAGLFSVPRTLLSAQSRAGVGARSVCRGRRLHALCRGAEPPSVIPSRGRRTRHAAVRTRHAPPCFLELWRVVTRVPLLFLEA